MNLYSSVTRIGLISDTHGLMRPAALEALRDSELILHAGDIGSAAILKALEPLAPVVAIRGNNDIDDWSRHLPETCVVEVGGFRIQLIHDAKEWVLEPATQPIHAVISGHSHKPSITSRDGVLFVNPGSAGPRRFKLPISVAKLHIEAGDLLAEIVGLID